jgi:spermidine/putrescine transport system permease protein
VSALPGRLKRTDGRRRLNSLLLAAPVSVYVAIFAVVPLGTLLLYSFYTDGFYTITHTLTLNNYTSLFDSEAGDVFFASLWRTILLALAVTAVAVALAYPAAYYCVRYLGRAKTLVFLLLVAPIFTSYLVKVYSWRGVLGERGLINYAAVEWGLADQPFSFLLFNRVAVAIALLSTVLPFVFIPIYTALERIPASLMHAASDLGASGRFTFVNVLLPLTRRGVVTASTLSFIICFGDFIASQLLGGASGVLVGKIVYSFFGLADDWPSGTARAFVVLFVTGAFVALFGFLARGSSSGDDVILDAQMTR